MSILEAACLTVYNPIISHRLPVSLFYQSKLGINHRREKSWKLGGLVVVASSSSPHPHVSSWTKDRTDGGQQIIDKEKSGKREEKKKRVFFLDVNPLCYNGSTPSLHSFAHWVSLFFSEISLTDPVIAVIDGERGNEYRRQILPSYKAHRRKASPQLGGSRRLERTPVTRSHQLVSDFLRNCNVPVVKIPLHEADDVIATLADQVLERGYRVVIASPDKDFKQLICEDVQLVMPVPELNRWSFYTMKHYVAQYNCDPRSDLSLRCIVGDEVDGVPGIQNAVPGFGMKTALKLVKRHGSLENLLNAAAVRTVGKQYIQDAVTKYADHFRRNYEVLSLKRDVKVYLQEDWLYERDAQNDSISFSNLIEVLGGAHNFKHQTGAHSNG